MNKPLWGQDMSEDFQVPLQKLEAVLTVFRVSVHKMLTPSGHWEVDSLAWVQALPTLLPGEDGLPLKQTGLVNAITAFPVCS